MAKLSLEITGEQADDLARQAESEDTSVEDLALRRLFETRSPKALREVLVRYDVDDGDPGADVRVRAPGLGIGAISLKSSNTVVVDAESYQILIDRLRTLETINRTRTKFARAHTVSAAPDDIDPEVELRRHQILDELVAESERLGLYQ